MALAREGDDGYAYGEVMVKDKQGRIKKGKELRKLKVKKKRRRQKNWRMK